MLNVAVDDFGCEKHDEMLNVVVEDFGGEIVCDEIVSDFGHDEKKLMVVCDGEFEEIVSDFGHGEMMLIVPCEKQELILNCDISSF